MRFVIVLSFAAAAMAQTSSGVVAGGGAISQPSPQIAISRSGTFIAVNGPLPGPGGLTGRPFSAEEITEQVQTLADGTHITQPPQKTLFYRDSLGRTRTEHTFPPRSGAAAARPAGPNFIEISDPVNGVHYSLNPRDKTARKMSFPVTLLSSPTAPLSRIFDPATAPAVVSVAIPMPPPADSQPPPQISRESLGTQTIEGVSAEGVRMTTTYPIGAIGNDRPITTTTETWTSPELGRVVLSKRSDPRTGDSTMRLTNISRAEPDPSLFQVPSDYEVMDEAAPNIVR